MNEDSVCVWAMGDAHELPRTGNVLIVDSMVMTKRKDMQWDEWDRTRLHPNDFPYSVRIREVTRQSPPEVLWELDLRDPEEYNLFHIKEALNYPAPNIGRDKMIPELFRFKNQPDKLIIIYMSDERKGTSVA